MLQTHPAKHRTANHRLQAPEADGQNATHADFFSSLLVLANAGGEGGIRTLETPQRA